MPKMGKYCKAYPVKRLREFSGWKENTQNLRTVENPEGEGNGPTPRTLTDDEHLYLQENFVVTDDIYLDEHIVFDDVTPEWINFCKETLKFEIPNYENNQVKNEEG